jgi:hypothetical protein
VRLLFSNSTTRPARPAASHLAARVRPLVPPHLRHLVGDFIQPRSRQQLGQTEVWAADNDAFSGFNPDRFRRMLDTMLQLLHGTEPFHLGSHDAAKLLGIAHTTVFCWFDSLTNESDSSPILQKVSVGSKAAGLTNEYLDLPLVIEGHPAPGKPHLQGKQRRRTVNKS